MGDSKYVAIPLGSFVGGSKAVVDLYVKLGDDHYTKVVSAADDFDLSRLSKYQDKEVTHLYVTKEDFPKFAENSANITEIVTRKSPASTRQKVGMILRTAEHVFTEFSDLGMEPKALDHALQVCSSTLSVIESKPNVVEMLDELSRYSQDFARHSLGTSLLSVMMVQGLKWTGKKSMNIASLGGLLHDVGMRELPNELLTKPRAEMTKEEIDLYQSHPMRGTLLLKEMKGIPDEVLSIVGEHHELPSGSGFPRGIKGDKIYPFARAVAFADSMADLVLKTDRNPQPKTLEEAMETIHHTMRHDFPAPYFEAAKRMIFGETPTKKAS